MSLIRTQPSPVENAGPGVSRADVGEFRERLLIDDLPADPFDVIVVGSGACGGWAAMDLAVAGMSVLVLEAGRAIGPDALDVTAVTADVRDEYRRRQPVQSRHAAWNGVHPELFVDDTQHPYVTPEDKPFSWIRARQMGGRSLMWGGVALRMSDFELRPSRYDGRGDDWPFTCSDLAPFYDRVESLWRVRGARDQLQQLPDGSYADPAPLTPGEEHFRTRVERRWPARRVIASRGISDSAEERATHGSSFPLASSLATTLRVAAATGRCRLRTHAIVSRVLLDGSTNRAIGVEFIDQRTGNVREVRARTIVLCASTLETTRILLASATPRYPTGLGDASGVLGRYLMDHPSTSLIGRAPMFDAPVEPFGGPHGIYIPRFENLGRGRSDFSGGYGVHGAVQRMLGDWTDARFLLIAVMEMLARRENFVQLHPSIKDAWGLPVLEIHCAYSDNEQAMNAAAAAALVEMAQEARFEPEVVLPLKPPGLFVHEVGTARMGTDPRSSFVDPWNRCWEIPNLLITDGACWVSSGYQNPTLTMAAITARACHALIDRMRSGEP
jgi:choline dehydrogenase-like flavoprotein